jgi:hypothetical protein
MDRTKLIDLTRRFTDAFNRHDLDAVMGFFSEDGVYDEFNGKRNRGKPRSGWPSSRSLPVRSAT